MGWGGGGGACQHLFNSSFCLSALELLQTAIEKAGFTDKVVVGMDVAASEFYRDGKYDLDFKSPPDPERHITAEELADIYQGFVNNYPGGRLCLFLLICSQRRSVLTSLSSLLHRLQWSPSRTRSIRTTGRPGPA